MFRSMYLAPSEKPPADVLPKIPERNTGCMPELRKTHTINFSMSWNCYSCFFFFFAPEMYREIDIVLVECLRFLFFCIDGY